MILPPHEARARSGSHWKRGKANKWCDEKSERPRKTGDLPRERLRNLTIPITNHDIEGTSGLPGLARSDLLRIASNTFTNSFICEFLCQTHLLKLHNNNHTFQKWVHLLSSGGIFLQSSRRRGHPQPASTGVPRPIEGTHF